MRGPYKTRLTLLDRFNSKWIPEAWSGCWLWIGALIGEYGSIRHTRENGHRNQFAHRVSWELHNGAIPGGLLVMHKCDTPSCVNPDHLSLGTYYDNRIDAANKDRQPIKLSDAQVKEIRGSTDSQICLARKFGVSQQHVSRIVRRKRRK
jgi:hypothetical protein